MADLVGKLQSTASASPTIRRKTDLLDGVRSQAVFEARNEWAEVYAYVSEVLLSETSTMARAQYVASRANVWDAGGKTISRVYKATPDRASSRTAALSLFKKYAATCGKAANDALSLAQARWREIDNASFKYGVMSIITKYMNEIGAEWTSVGGSLYSRWSAIYQANSKAYGATALKDMLDTIDLTHSTMVDSYQLRMFTTLIREVKKLWEDTVLRAALAEVDQGIEETNASNGYTTIRPFDVVSITADNAPLYNGYPSATDLWVRVTPELNTAGEVFSSQRLTPTEIVLSSDQRWVADDSFWDETTGVWRPYVDTYNYRIIAANLANMPIMSTTSYTIGREFVTRTSFRITDESKFLCFFNGGLDSLHSFTISMVIAPNPSPFSYPILDYWYTATLDGSGASQTPAAGDRFGWWLNDRLDFYYGNTGGSVDQIASLSKVRPLVITSTVDNGQCTTYVGYSPRHNLSTVIKSKVTNTTQWMRFQIGGTYQTLAAGQHSDFNLYEMNMWTRALSNEEVIALHSDYYSVYGTSNDWR